MPMNRHERRRAKVLERKNIPMEKIAGHLCAWDGCERTFQGEMPRGWSFMLLYWSKWPSLEFWDIPPNDGLRDAVLCPEHTKQLDGNLLKDIGQDLMRPPIGSA